MRQLQERAEALRLRVEVHDASYVSYLPYNEKTSMACLIDDDELSRRVGEQMIAAGMPVINVEL